uniref:uncharacterized protein CFAP92 n=1 Tax=Euleptes europaea TaxID=460621 RepID=UPI0025426253|nr:uncharacterized protein CFAP92 [Euleptes europaea]
MAKNTSADGVDGQMEEERKQEGLETTPVKSPEKETSLGSGSTNGTDSPVADGSGNPTPEDESGVPTGSEESQESETSRLITCTFSVSLAVPLSLTRKSWSSSGQDISRTASKVREGVIPRMHRFYHMEYFLLPDDTEPRKLDLVLFGSVAKLFLDSESKVVKPWLENDQVWVSWSHIIEINVTNDFLVKLRDHKIKLRLWDSRDKLCTRAKFCKPPKGIGASPDVDGWVKNVVLFQRENLKRTQPKPSYTKVRTAKVSTVQEKSAVSAMPGRNGNKCHCNVSIFLVASHFYFVALCNDKEICMNIRCLSGLISATSKDQVEESEAVEVLTSAVRIASSPCVSKSEEFRTLSLISISGSIPSSLRERTLREAKQIKQKYSSTKISKQTNSPKSDLKKNEEQGSKRDKKNSLTVQFPENKGRRKSLHVPAEKRPGSRKTSPKDSSAQAYARKHGIAFIQLDLMPLLSGECCVTNQLEEKSSKLSNVYVGFSFEGPLMTQKQKQDLNPLIIKILSAKCLPDTPVSIEKLQHWCDPVYCKYTFHDLPARKTQGRNHGTDVFFMDLNVILAGTMEPQELREYLRGPPLEIEVHDRDKKLEEITKKPSLFGDEPGDSKLTHLSPSRYTVQNSMTAKEEIWHPHGVAKISLAELLLGEKHLNICVPIQCCSVQDTSICMAENVSWKSKATDGSLPAPLPMGHYLDSEAHLKVRIEIALPLGPEDEIADTGYCPYGCIIYIFDYKNKSLLSYLLQQITEINAKAFQLDSYPLHIIQKSLNTLKLTSKLSPEEISQMDIITGFHVMDGSVHLLVVEGLKDKALEKMWNKRIDRMQEAKTGRLEIFYNSQLSFHQRLYVDLEAILYHIRLCKPLSSITKQPLLYIRDMVPQACFQALSRLDYICHSKKLRDVVHYDLLPSVEMITSLSQEFGIPLAKDDLLIQQHPEIVEICQHPSSFQRKQRRWSLLDNQNKLYMLRKREMESEAPQDYIQANIDNVSLLSKMMQNETPSVIRACPSDGKSIFNYSIQKLNSAEIAKHLLRQEMAQAPGKRYAYSHNYLSGMFDPVDKDSTRKDSFALSKKKWLTSEGFVFPGFKSSFESNMHCHMPDEARLEELTEKWEENILHRSILKPVLDRDRWTWDKRKLDFDLYTKPSYSFVGLDTYVIEHQKDARCNTGLRVHRCCPETELISRGPKASCQLARIQGLLKDKPMKLALKSHVRGIQDIPAVGSLVRADSDICRGFIPGSDDFHSLKWNGNIIPCHDREHSMFKTLKGADFRLNCHNHSFNYQRKSLQRWFLKNEMLTSGEKQEEGKLGRYSQVAVKSVILCVQNSHEQSSVP